MDDFNSPSPCHTAREHSPHCLKHAAALALVSATLLITGCGGDDGNDGGASLIEQTAEPAGEHCETGGTRIDTGLDSDGDGTLDDNEITHTSYVCNGINPPKEPELSLTPQSVKTFQFTWNELGPISEYRLLVNPDGASGYSEEATFAGDLTEYDLQVFLPAHLNASYMLEACNAAGCTESNEVFVNSTLSEAIGYLKASDTDTNDGFGRAVAIADAGRTLVVGAPGEDGEADAASLSGAVYVFRYHDDGGWQQEAYLRASNVEAGDQFGDAIALASDGQTLAVGADGEDSAATGINGTQTDNSVADSGAVYVFRRDDNGNWSQDAYLKASNTGEDDAFGASLALSSDGARLAVGAYGEASSASGIGGDQSDDSAANTGAIYVFDRGADDWSQHSYLKASNAEQLDLFGQSVALSGDGNTLAAGAFREASAATGVNGDQSDNTAVTSGAVYVYLRDAGGTWSQSAYLKASNTQSGDNFGRSLSLDQAGTTLAVGANQEDGAAPGVGGDQTDNSALSSGAVYLFRLTGTAWQQQAYLKAAQPGAGDSFGFNVSLSSDGDTLAVGANGEASAASGIEGDQGDDSAAGSGAAYLFRYAAGAWSQSRYLKAPNAEADDNFGYRLSLSTDAGTLAVAASAEASTATGVGGDQADNSASDSGAVYLY